MTIIKFKKENSSVESKHPANAHVQKSFLHKSPDGVIYSSDRKTLIHCPKTFAGHFDVAQGVETIGIEAFAGCKQLLSLSIPESVRKICMLAFAECKSLQQITLKSIQTIQISEDSFTGVDKTNCVIQIPASVISDYKNDIHWMEFKDIVALKEMIEFKVENRKQVI